jgi:hypothetical protein
MTYSCDQRRKQASIYRIEEDPGAAGGQNRWLRRARIRRPAPQPIRCSPNVR